MRVSPLVVIYTIKIPQMPADYNIFIRGRAGEGAFLPEYDQLLRATGFGDVRDVAATVDIVEDVDEHGAEVQPQPLQHPVRHAVRIHDYHQGGQGPDIATRLGAAVEEPPQRRTQQEEQGRYQAGKEETGAQEALDAAPQPRQVALQLGGGHLRDEHLRQGVEENGGEAQHGKDHAADGAVDPQGGGGGLPEAHQRPGHQQVLQGAQGRAGIGAEGQGQAEAKEPRSHVPPFSGAGYVFLLQAVEQPAQHEGKKVRRRAAEGYRGAAELRPRLGDAGQREEGEGGGGQLLQHLGRSRLPGAAHGGEIAGKDAAQAQRDKGEGKEPQGEPQPPVPGQSGGRAGEQSQPQPGQAAEKEGVAHTGAHHPAHLRLPSPRQLLGSKAGDAEMDAAAGQGDGQGLHAETQLHQAHALGPHEAGDAAVDKDARQP